MSNDETRHLRVSGRQFYCLGIGLLVLAAMYPILGLGRIGLIIWTVTFWVVLLAAIHATSAHRRVHIIARILGGLALSAGVAGVICYEYLGPPHTWVMLVVNAITLVFLVFVTASILYEVLRSCSINADHLVGAATAYVLIGVTFTYVFLVLEGLTGSSILMRESAIGAQLVDVANDRLADYLYYSFVTLTTLGFGDLTPRTLPARVLTGVEAITGQLFLTILIARLIGLHVVHASRESGE